MGRSSDKIVNIQDRDVSLLFAENGQCYANAFIDDNHYFDVISAVSEDDMTELLNVLNIFIHPILNNQQYNYNYNSWETPTCNSEKTNDSILVK